MNHIKRFAIFPLICIFIATCIGADEPSTQPASLLKDATFDHVDSIWQASSLEGGSVSITKDATAKPPALAITVDKVDGTDWHAQVFQANLSVTKGAKYTLEFTAKATAPRKIAVFMQTLANPYTMLTEGRAVDLTPDAKPQKVEFTATDTSSDAKLAIVVGQATGTITISDISLRKAD